MLSCTTLFMLMVILLFSALCGYQYCALYLYYSQTIWYFVHALCLYEFYAVLCIIPYIQGMHMMYVIENTTNFYLYILKAQTD